MNVIELITWSGVMNWLDWFLIVVSIGNIASVVVHYIILKRRGWL